VKHDADDAIARLLRGRVEAGPPAGPCLDAEMVAAWFDGTLTPARQREAESHASTCARCQALLAAMAGVAVVVIALLSGNVGTLVRLRVLAIPYLASISTVGLCELLTRPLRRESIRAFGKAEPIWP